MRLENEIEQEAMLDLMIHQDTVQLINSLCGCQWFLSIQLTINYINMSIARHHR